jgi:F-box protein 18 (helicase)
MTFNLTQEQREVVDYAKQAENGELLLIDSVAGSGKTTLLRAIADEVDISNGLYLAYNKAIATSSKDKFPNYIDCRTTHSLAYRATVTSMGLRVGFFGPRQITERMSSTDKHLLTEDIKEFCLSSHLTYQGYAEDTGRVNTATANKYLNLMSEGKIECTHDFYLKMFHLVLADGSFKPSKYDIVMLDEAGDLNEVTLEIFRLLPAKLKIAVGDPHQNIYTFNHTINCFERLSDEGTTFKLSKSFRVPVHIAEPIEKFCQAYLNPGMEFKGIESTNTKIRNRGYIARTNGGLVNKMIELNNDRVPYGLVRKAQEIFKIPLMVAGMKYQGKIYDPAYKHLQDDIDDWYENVDGAQKIYKTLPGYLKNKHGEDLSLGQAINLVGKHGKGGIFDAYAEAKNHEGSKQDFMLLTAHSAKGLEFDEVILAPDMNTSIENLVEELKEEAKSGDVKRVLSSQEKESLNLYYVGCSRALVSLKNAEYLR